MPSPSVKNAWPTIRTEACRPPSVRRSVSPTAMPAASRNRWVTTASPGPPSQRPETVGGAPHAESPWYATTVVAPVMPRTLTSAPAVP
jgi:hypothetical protein